MDLFSVCRLSAFRTAVRSLILLSSLHLSSANASSCESDNASAAERFRAIFFSEGAQRYSKEQLSTLLFQPPESLEASDLLYWRGSKFPLAQFDKASLALHPSGAFEEGRARNSCLHPASVSRNSGDEAPLFVVLPELLAEMVDNVPFKEIVEREDSAFANQWREKISTHPVADDLTDWSFDLNSLRQVRVPMDRLFAAGSIDSADGTPIVKVVSMRTPMGSTESIGFAADSSRIFLSRLNRFFNIVGANQPVFLLGYSRGSVIALEMLSRAAERPEEMPWFSSVRGMISLSGVNFGSVLADSVFTSGSPTNQVLFSLRDLAVSLEKNEPGDTPVTLARKVSANTLRWTSGGADVLQKLAMFPLAEGFRAETEGLAIPAKEKLVSFMRRLLFETFQLDRPFSDYFDNVRRFKLFIAQVERAIGELTTESRLQWWRQHRLPSGVDLLAVGATMGDPWSATKGSWGLTKNRLAYDPSLFDYLFLRMTYYENYRSSGFSINDGMVSLERTLFWPNLITSLNTENADLRLHNLALFGVDHFGLVLESSAPASATRKSPFPRELVLRALGRYVKESVR